MDINAKAYNAFISAPIAAPGLCVRNEKKGATVNIHFVRDGQVYYGMYKNDETGLDGTAVELSRMDINIFNSLLVKAAIDGHSLFSLVAT